MPSPRLLALAALLAALSGGCAGAPPPHPVAPAAPAPAPAPDLPAVPTPPAAELVPIEPGQRHRYRLDAGGGRWLSIELWQREADLALRVLDPSGREVAASAVPGNWSFEVVDLTTAQDGRHVVEVAADDGARAGAYRLHLVEDRAARDDDAARREARREVRDLARRRHALEIEPADAAAALRRLRDDAGVDWTGEERAAIARELGDALLDAGATEEASAAYRDGLDGLPQPYASARAARLVHGLARTSQRAQSFEHARRWFGEAAAIARAAGDEAVLGDVLADEAAFLQTRGDFDGAFERAADAARAHGAGGDLAREVLSRLDLVSLHWMRGDPAAALDELERAARLAAAASVESHEVRFRLPLAWSVHYRASGEMDKAQTALESALEAAEASGSAGHEMHTRMHLAAVLNQLGDYGRARGLLLRAAELALAHGSASDRAAVSVQLAWAALGEGDATTARQQVLDVLDDSPLRPDLVISALYALATAEIALGDHEAARTRLAEALRRATDADMRLWAVDVRRTLGSLQLDVGDLDGAAEWLGEALRGAAEMADPLREAAAASLLARVAAERGDPHTALAHARRAIALREEVRSRIVAPSLRASFLARWRGDFDLAIEMLLLLSRSQGAEDHLPEAFRLSEAAHARTLTELLAEAKIDVRSGIADRLLEAQQEAELRLSQVQGRLTGALAKAADAEQVARLEDERWQAHRAVEAVDASIRREHPRYADLHRPLPPSLQEVQAWLDDDTALVEYALGERSSALFVVTRRDFAAFALPAADEIAERVTAVRELLDAPLGRARLAAELAELSAILLAPAARQLSTVDRLLVVPDRDLFYLPFEALTDPAAPAQDLGGALRRWTITYLPSAAVIAYFQDEQPVEWQREVLLFAAPPGLAVADSATARRGESHLVPSGGLRELSGAQHEAQRIAELFSPDAELYLGEDAREALLKNPGAVPPARRLHIASHGHISEVDPAASYVLLAADDVEDGLLQIHEVFDLELTAELVVLSGCDTALGRRVDGEGLLGLSRAFLYAGARELIVSLRPVADLATAELMVDLYGHLRAGLRSDEALRRAKLTALDAGASPADWAPFVVFAPPPAPVDPQ